MSERVMYLLMVVIVGWAVTFGLRALPFMLFAGRDRGLPKWLEKASAFVSPVIIACLIVYSYSGLEWRTVWPYLAGVLTVGLQVWKRNPLMSILAGTALYMTLLANCGCASTPDKIEFNAQHPAISVSQVGVKFGDQLVDPEDVPGILEDYDVPKTRTIHIQLDPELKDLTLARTVMGYLARGGYTRPVLVTRRHGESFATGKKPSRAQAKPVSTKKTIRYKKANEQ